jgi:hypothetical protein
VDWADGETLVAVADGADGAGREDVTVAGVIERLLDVS